MQTKLKRHLLRCHSEEKDVALMVSSSFTDEKIISAKLRKRGILLENKKQLASETPTYLAERKCDANKVLCSGCSGFYSENTFYKHKTICLGSPLPSRVEMKCMSASPSSSHSFEAMLSSIQNDEVGNMAKTDPTIRIIGERRFQACKKKVDLEQESRRTVRAEMRLLAKLYLEFKEEEGAPESTNAAVMFNRRHFSILERAIESISTRSDQDGSLKYGTKYKLYYILRNSALIMKATYLTRQEDDSAQEVDYFMDVLKLNQNSILGEASYEINKARSEKLRMPEQIASEDDVKIFRDFICHKIEKLTGNVSDVESFIPLRNALCARLTLYNARRGNEATRMKLSHWQDAISQRWCNEVKKDELDQLEKRLLSDNMICYIRGKGGKQVPVIIPADCVKGLKILADPSIRNQVGVSQNKYIFGSTGSQNHVEGWHCISELAEQAGVSDKSTLTATRQRHRISTKFASLDLTASERTLFYSHMGHTENVSKESYQHPQALKSLFCVGKRLEEFDRGN